MYGHAFAAEVKCTKWEIIKEEEAKKKALKKGRKLEKILEARNQEARKHTMRNLQGRLASAVCGYCGERYNSKHIFKVWGKAAEPDDRQLHAKARETVLKRQHFPSVVSIESHTEKEYRSLGGTYSFPDPQRDTFIVGLHGRIEALYREWSDASMLQKKSVDEAVQESMLRIRWDDRIPGAREKLTHIVRFLWGVYSGEMKIGLISEIPSSIAPSSQ